MRRGWCYLAFVDQAHLCTCHTEDVLLRSIAQDDDPFFGSQRNGLHHMGRFLSLCRAGCGGAFEQAQKQPCQRQDKGQRKGGDQ